MGDATIALPIPTTPTVGREDQARVFRNLRATLARNGLRVLLETGRIRLYTMIGTSAFVALLVFGLSLFGFMELFNFKLPIKGFIVGGLFDLMFFTLGAMLLLSTGIILYASLYTAPEAKFLLTTPARADRIFATKFEGAVAFSSWGFVVLGFPVLIAYGFVAGVPWYYYPLLPLFLLGFVLLPAAASAMVCLLLVRFLPRNRKQALIAGGIVGTLAIGFWLYRVGLAAKTGLMNNNRDALDGFVGQFAMAQASFTPSHWMTTGLMAAARGEVAEILTPLALLWSNGLMMFLAATWMARRIYRTGFDRITGTGRGKKIYRASILDRLMEWSVFYLDRPTRILVVKDFRTFRRDPSQWVLLFIFGGMLFIGARNFQQYYSADLDTLDKYIIGLVNLAGTSILLCAGLSRFIFPLISLEGRKFWILGLMPLHRRQIVIGKFAFAATGSLLIAETLVVGSEILLGLSPGGILIHAVTVAVMALGLSSLNVGLGAYMPNFRETDPSKIVVGFSGTVNMVVGLGYVLIIITVMAVPMHAAAVLKHFNKITTTGFPWWAFAGLPVGIIICALTIWLPMRAGTRALETAEF